MKTNWLMRTIIVLSLIGCQVGYAVPLDFAPPASVGMNPQKLDKVKDIVGDMVENQKLAGATVIIARKEKVVFFETFGERDQAANDPIKRNTIFRFYSMSKPITSVAIMMLCEQGKLKLDAPVADYIPEFKDLKVYGPGGKLVEPDRAMTVRDLLRHTSGLTYGIFGNTPVDKLYRKANVLDRNAPVREMAKKLGSIPLQYQPGTKWHYGVSTDVLGCLVEVASGKPLDKFFSENIFAPLGMKDTAFYAPSKKAHRFASCYGPDGNGGLKVSDAAATSRFLKKPAMFSGGDGLVSTASDYIRLCQMLLNKGELDGKRLLKTETVEAMTKDQLPPSVTRSGGNEGFGLGFSVKLKEGTSPIGEYGWGGAASTHFWISPKDELAVVALSQVMPFSGQLESAVKSAIYDSIENR